MPNRIAMAPPESPRPRPRDRPSRHERPRSHSQSPRKHRDKATSNFEALSADALAKHDRLNRYPTRPAEERPRKTRKRYREVVQDEKVAAEQNRRQQKRRKRRLFSDAPLEEGNDQRFKGLRGGYGYVTYEEAGRVKHSGKRKKRLCRWSFFAALFVCRAQRLTTSGTRDMCWCLCAALDNHNPRNDCCQQEEQLEFEFGLEYARRRN